MNSSPVGGLTNPQQLWQMVSPPRGKLFANALAVSACHALADFASALHDTFASINSAAEARRT